MKNIFVKRVLLALLVILVLLISYDLRETILHLGKFY